MSLLRYLYILIAPCIHSGPSMTQTQLDPSSHFSNAA
jgi:hypothetical protein